MHRLINVILLSWIFPVTKWFISEKVKIGIVNVAIRITDIASKSPEWNREGADCEEKRLSLDKKSTSNPIQNSRF